MLFLDMRSACLTLKQTINTVFWQVVFNNNAWKSNVNAVIHVANLLGRNYERTNGTGGRLDDELMLAISRTIVEMEPLFFGQAFAFEPYFYQNLSIFSTYTSRTAGNNSLLSRSDMSDIAPIYFEAEWYAQPKLKMQDITSFKTETNVTRKLR